MSQGQPIRIAVLTRGNSLEAWEVNALHAVQALTFAEIVLEIQDGSPAEEKSFGKRISTYKWSRLLWNRWFKRYGKVNAARQIETNPIFHPIPKIVVTPQLKGKHSQYFSDDDIKTIAAYAPDVIIRFGFNILRGEILTLPKFGVWSYHHADHETIRGGPAGFWEYILGHNITGAILQQLTEKLDDGIILRRGYWPLVKHSFRENLDALLNSTSDWIANALTEIHHHGKVSVQTGITRIDPKVPLYSYPGNFRMLHFWLVLLRNKFSFHWTNLFRPETWMIGVIDQPLTDVIENGIRNNPKWISAQNSYEYLADPFAINYNGKDIILAELYSYREQKGRIINTESFETYAESRYHVSFPYPINVEGKQYILPESAESLHCSLYDLPGHEPSIMLVHEPLVDPVLIEHNGLYWLFAHHLNIQNNSALFIYYSDDITAKFKPHALNPVKTDIRNSRSAGPIININNRLLRPAQDSSRTYGGAIVINEITELSPISFAEHPIRRIEPKSDWKYNKGLHTISPQGPNRTLIDAKSFRFNFANFRAQLKRKSRRLSR